MEKIQNNTKKRKSVKHKHGNSAKKEKANAALKELLIEAFLPFTFNLKKRSFAMRTNSRFLLAAGVMLAMALTFSCSSGDNSGSNSPPPEIMENSSSSDDGGNQSSSSNNENNGSSSSGFNGSSSSVVSGNSSSSGNSENNGSSSSDFGTSSSSGASSSSADSGNSSSSGNSGASSSSVTLKECTDIFNPANKFCYDGVVYDRCNGNEYDPINHKCENSILKDKCGTGWYDPATEQCCGNNKYTISTQFCNENGVFNKCDGMEYPPTTHICQGDVAVLAVCNGNEYNPINHKCENNILKDKCGTGWYDPITEYCSNGTVKIYGSLVYGQTYKTVVIGTQTWMAENLNYNASGSVCYDNNTANCTTYGRLYDWATAKTVCPSGWHLPSNADWDKLYRYTDGTSGTESPYSSPTAGKYLKATSGWSGLVFNGNGEDTYGFSALPGGIGNSDGNFNFVGHSGYWWSSSELSPYAYYRNMDYLNERASYSVRDKSYLHSVRCLKD